MYALGTITILLVLILLGAGIGGLIVGKAMGNRTAHRDGASSSDGLFGLVKTLLLIVFLGGGTLLALGMFFLVPSHQSYPTNDVSPHLSAHISVDTSQKKLGLHLNAAPGAPSHAESAAEAEPSSPWIDYLHRAFISEADKEENFLGFGAALWRDLINVALALAFITLWQAWSRNTP